MTQTTAKSMKKILLVDDDVQFVKLLRGLLREEGYIVNAAHDGQTAITSAHRYHPDVILMDINMPLMDGLRAFSRLREETDTSRIPVIFISEITSEFVNPILHSSSRAAHLKKPFDMLDLTSLIRQFSQTYAS